MNTPAYKIRSFDEETAQVIVECENLPPFAVDLTIDDNGNVPEGEALQDAIRQFIPVWVLERKQKLSAGIKNAAAVKAIVEPYPSPAIEVLEQKARDTRNLMLLDSDWTQLSDAPLNEQQKLAWANYRQQLRDITSQPEFPTNITWPDAPI